MRHKDKKNIIFLFKREGTLTSIVPLVTYYTYGFHMLYWKSKLPPYPNVQNIYITQQTIDSFYHFSKTIQLNYKCFIVPCLSNLTTLINAKLIHIFLLFKDKNPFACYIFRNPYTFYSICGEKKQSIDLIASYCHNKSQNWKIFVDYFYHCVFQIQKKNQLNFYWLKIFRIIILLFRIF